MSESRCIPLSALELSAAIRSGQPYDAARLNRVLGVDARHGLIEVQASTPWSSVAACLRPGDARAARAVLAALPTVGESLAHNAAGPDGRATVAHVESMTLVAPGGELRRISRTAQRELFALVAGGHGLFGALYSVTLVVGSLARTVNEAADAEVIATPQVEPEPGPLRLFVPPDRLESFLADARHLCAEWRMPLAGVEARRTLPEDDSFLRWARREYAAVALRLPRVPALGAAVRATQLRRQLIDAAIACGGSFHIACTPEATREQTEACYPQLPAFLAEKRRVDPGERLSNAWYRHYRSLFARGTCDVRWGR